jgi:acyl transferase domain-containing protein/NADPH:quinone reductase-like Zn-dependent oxidoreductase
LLSEQSSRVSKASIGQPLCTAIQLALVDLLASWNIKPSAVTGHSSGEIAAAYASGALDFKDALKVSFYRGQLANTIPEKASHLKGAMLAVGLSEEKARRIINQLEGKGGKMVVACVNSPSSVTVSGDESAIIEVQDILEARMIFNRRLVVDTAYHSHHMEVIAREYLTSLSDIQPQKTSEFVRFVSSVTGRQMAGNELDAAYWVRNMVSQVRFSMALECMCIRPAEKQLGQSWSKYAVDSIVEIGPHSALAGPIKQTLKSDKLQDAKIRYLSALVRGKDACTTALDVAGSLFTEGFSVDLTSVNFPHGRGKRNVLVDLPSYPWNHGTKYWDESRLSSEYRLRKHPRHPLLGVPAPDYNPLEPRWRNVIRLSEFPWLRGHVVQSSIVYPAAGYIAMVIEAAKQRHVGSGRKDHILKYGFRDVNVGKALVIPDTPEGVELMLSIRPYARTARDSSDTWDEFRIFSFAEKEGWSEHCRGLISLQFKAGSADFEGDRETHFAAMRHADKFSKAEAHCKAVLEPKELYEGLANLGLEYSGVFTGVVSIRAQPNESLVVVQIPDTKSMLPGNFEQPHVLHPATLDACFQTIFCAMMKGVGITDTLVPTFIEELSVSGDITNKPGHEFKVLSSTTASGLRGLKADLVVANVCSTGLPLISIQGLKCTALLGGGPNETLPTSQEKRMCHKLKWLPDLELLEATQIKELCKKNLSDESHADMLWVLNAVTDLAIRDTLKSLEGWDKTLLSLHHKHMYEWMTKYAKESPVHPGSQACDLRRRAETFGSHGEMTLRIGDNLTAIFKGEIDPLSLMMEKNLLYQVYADESSRRCHVQMIEYVDVLAHKHPDMKVLEIGAGTGGTTLPILRAFGGGSPGSGPARLGHFDFTDISSGFFEKAEELLKPWEGLVSFKKLDIEKDTKAQGFEDASYDLIVASNVLHATAVMDVTMSNVRRLLKPGGKLMLSEITRPTPYIGLVFGTLPGWWLGAPDGRVDSPLMSEETWEATLLRSGFTGLDLCLQDYPAENSKYAVTSVIVSSAKPVTPQPAFSPVELIYGQRSASISIPLAKLLNANLTTLEQTSATGKVCVVLPEMHEHILSSGSPSQFGAIKNMLSTAKGVLWVTQGAAMDCTAPDNSLITGLARTVRNDNEALRLVTLDMDPNSERSDAETAEIIYNVYKSAFNDAMQSESQDSEFAERGGQVFIPRLVEDSELNTYLKASTTVRDPELQPFFQEGRALHLEVGQPGLLDSLRWVDDETALLPLAPDEIRLELRAAGINFRDIMISLGQLEGTSRMGGECAGVVTDVGSNMTKKFKVGDRVCSWGAGAYASSARVHGPSAQHIPDDMSFETAASLPIVYTTVYYSLVYLARLQKGETILIHSAAGGVGQAAIMLSQHIGAKAFVTVGSEEKKRFLMDNYHIPEERIFSSRQTTFGEGIKRLTGGKGVDVVLNSLTGEGFRETCNCVAYFGRFIEIGKRDVLMNARMDMALFDKNVTFSSVDLTKVCDHDVNLAGRLFKEVFDLIRQGSVGAVKPVTILPLSEIETAFRQIQAGKHMGKIVLQAQPDVQVKVSDSNLSMIPARILTIVRSFLAPLRP